MVKEAFFCSRYCIRFNFFFSFFFFWTTVSFDLSLRLDGVRSSRGVNSEKSLCFFVNFSN